MDPHSQPSTHIENLVDLNEFLEYYTYVSALYETDSEFDKVLSNTWNIDSNMNPSAIPYAGISKRVTKVNTKERWLNDHHRAIVGGNEYNVINPHTSSFPVPFEYK
jgi:acid phosphatase class B